MAGDATYTISGGTTVKKVDQGTGSNTWAHLGLMAVSAAGPVTVKLAPSSTEKVSADAVRALPVTNAATSANNIFTDHLYAPRVITRASDNQMVWRWDNADPFGIGQPDTNPAGLATTFTYNPRFPGQLYDTETGLHYNYHRTYSPAIGAYTQPDPIGLNGGQLSLYGYVGGNPVNRIDPLGLSDYAPGIGGVFSEFWDWYYKKNPPITDPPPKPECPDKDCKNQFEREDMMCELLAGPRYWLGSKQAVTICKKAAFVRYTECLRGVPESERSPFTGVDTPI